MPTQEHGIELSIKATKAKIGAQEYNRAANTVVAGAAKAKGAVAATNTTIAATATATKTATGGLLALQAGYLKVLAVGYGAYKLLRSGADFERSLARVRSIATAGVESAAQQTAIMETLESKARELGASTVFTATEVLSALESLKRGGLEVEDTVKAVGHVLNLAKAETIDLGLATDITVGTLNAFALSASATEHAVDVLKNTASSTASTLPQIYEGLSQVGTLAAAAGLSLEETAAALGVLHDANIKGGRSGTQMRGILARLLKPTNEVEEAILGLTDATTGMKLTLDDVDPRVKGLIGTFRAFERANLDVASAVKIFGTEQVSGSTAISRMVDKLERVTQANEEVDGAVRKASDTMSQGFISRVTELGSAFESLGISIWKSGIGAALTWTVEQLTAFVRNWDETISTIRGVYFGEPDAMLKVKDGVNTFIYYLDQAAVHVEYTFDQIDAYVRNGVQKIAKSLSTAIFGDADDTLSKVLQNAPDWLYGEGQAKQLREAGKQLEKTLAESRAGETGQLAVDMKAAEDRHAAGVAAAQQRWFDRLEEDKKFLDMIDKRNQLELKKRGKEPDKPSLDELLGPEGETPPGVPDFDSQMRADAGRAMKDYIDRIKLERETALLSNDERERALHLFELERIARTAGIDDIKETTAEMEKELRTMQRLRKLREFADDIGNAFGQAAADIIQDFKSVEDAAERMLRTLQRIVLEHAIARPIAENVARLIVGVGGALAGAGDTGATRFHGLGPAPGVSSIRGNVFDSGIVRGMQSGGIYNVPRYFRSGPDRGVMGEGGIEAALPLGRTADGRLGVVVANGGSTAPTIIMNVYTQDADSFRRSDRQIFRRARAAMGRSV